MNANVVMCAWNRVVLFLVAVAPVAVAVGGCVSNDSGTDPEIAEAISLLGTDSIENLIRASRILRSKGSEAVPVLMDALDGAGADKTFEICSILRKIGDKQCVSALVPIADRVPDAKMTADAYNGKDDKTLLALAAMKAIVCICHPESKKWFGYSLAVSDTRAMPEFKIICDYYKRVGEWYRLWRTTYEPGKGCGQTLVPTTRLSIQ